MQDAMVKKRQRDEDAPQAYVHRAPNAKQQCQHRKEDTAQAQHHRQVNAERQRQQRIEDTPQAQVHRQLDVDRQRDLRARGSKRRCTASATLQLCDEENQQ